jgi:hypothetical protein
LARAAARWLLAALSMTFSVWVGAVQCPLQIDPDDCVSNDLQPTGVEIVAGPTRCTEGEVISATVRIRFDQGGGANERFNVGFFVGDNGEPAIGGASCTFDSLQPIGGTPDLTGGSGPFLELNGDACGDISQSDPTYKDIQLDQLLCKDSDGNGKVDVAVALTWVSNANQAECLDPSDPAEFRLEPPKCGATPEYDVPITVQPPPSLAVGKGAFPSRVPEPGSLIRYPVTIINTSPAPTDALQVFSIVDDLYGDVTGIVDCTTPFILVPGEARACNFVEEVSGVEGDVVGGTVTVTGRDAQGDLAEGSDFASVEIIG